MEIIQKPISFDDFHALCRRVGWGDVRCEDYELAVQNSIACVQAVIDGQVVGFVRLIGDRGLYLYVQDLVVDPQYQGQGVGARLMSELEHIVKTLEGGRRKLTLIVAHDVRDFYKKCGYDDCDPPSKIMTKPLLPVEA